jgi:hypothetical protein
MKRSLFSTIAVAIAIALAALAHAQPANDLCANATPVTANSSTPFDLTGSTADGVYSCYGSGSNPYQDIWFRYTAAGAEQVVVDLCGSDMEAGTTLQQVCLAVFSGSCAGPQVICRSGGTCPTSGGPLPQGYFNIPSAGTYYIAVAQILSHTGPRTGVLNLHAYPANVPPINNVCSGALPLTDGENYIINAFATQDTQVPCLAAGPIQSGKDVWYSYTAPASGVRNFEVTRFCAAANQNTFATTLAIYDACVGNLLACDDDSGMGPWSKINAFPITAGTSYIVRFSNRALSTSNSAGTGTLTISVPHQASIPFDDCATAVPVVGQTTVPFDTSGLTTKSLMPWDCENMLHNDGWFAWTPTLTGVGEVDACGSVGVPPSPLAVVGLSAYTACGAPPLACVTETAEFYDPTLPTCYPRICFQVVAGQTYYVRFGTQTDYHRAYGSMHFDVRAPFAGISIPEKALAEPGNCDDAPVNDLNGGCNVVPPAFTPLNLCEIRSGTASSRLLPINYATDPASLTVDSDWYEFTLDTDQVVTVTGQSEFNPRCGIWVNCPAVLVKQNNSLSPRCDNTYSINLTTTTLPAGTYHLVIAPREPSGAWDAGNDCSQHSRYWFKVTGAAPCSGACCTGTACAISTQAACAASYSGDGTSCGTPTNPIACCPANFDHVDGLQVADIFAFLNAWFAGAPASDFDHINGLQVADIFAFLNAWFAGC